MHIRERGECPRCKQDGPLHPIPLYYQRATMRGMVDVFDQCCPLCVAEVQAKDAGRCIIYTKS